MSTQTEFSKTEDALITKSFTDDFINGKINLQDKFNELKVEVDRVDIYENGGIMSIAVDLSDENKSVLETIVKDFEAYDELIDLGFNSGKKEKQTDLVSILDYSENKLKTTILYNWDGKFFEFE